MTDLLPLARRRARAGTAVAARACLCRPRRRTREGVPPSIDDPLPPGSPGPVQEPPRPPPPIVAARERAAGGARRARRRRPSTGRRPDWSGSATTSPGSGASGVGDGFRYRGTDGRLIRKAAELRRIRAPGDPAGLRAGLDLPAAERPPAGDRARRARPQAVPLPPRLAAGARRRQVRAHARVRRARCRASGSASGPTWRRRSARRRGARRCWRRWSGCSTPPWSGSATTNTRATNRSFGLTTLRNRHADVQGSRMRLAFRGKSGIEHEVDLDDPRVARVVRRCQAMPGQDLFQYEDEDGSVRAVGSADVNDYIREAAGADFTAKDFRTWHGSVHALGLGPSSAPPMPAAGAAPTSCSLEVARAPRQHGGGVQEVVRPSPGPGDARHPGGQRRRSPGSTVAAAPA